MGMQMMQMEPFDDEPVSVALMDTYLAEKWETVIGHPVKRV